MFSDVDIRKEVAKGKKAMLMIQNFDDQCLTPVGYDIRAGETVFSLRKKQVISLDAGEFELKPKDTVFISSFESIRLSNHIGGFTVSKLGPQLDNIFCTTLPIDPTWNGKLLIILTNLGQTSFKIRYKDRLLTACFFRMQTASRQEISRQRWDNENIRQKFRQLEKDATKLRKRLLVIDFCVVVGVLLLMIGLWLLSLLPDFVSTLTLAIASIAIYFSSIRKGLE